MSVALLLSLKGRKKVVLKIAPHRVVTDYEKEAYQLNYLRDLGLPTPEVYVSRVADLDFPHSYLLLEHLEGMPLAEARRTCSEDDFAHLQMHLADLVLSLHARTHRHYARVDDGQSEGTTDFVQFFHQSYDPILQHVVQMKELSPGLRRRINTIHGHLDTLLSHSDRPRLIHGDLWSANLLARPDAKGKWWISGVLDPNCRFSHYEVEIAYLDLFRTITPAFLRAYQQTHRLDADYHQRRKAVYQMYPLLNNVHLFGAKYIRPLEELVERVMAASRRKNSAA